MAKGEAKPGLCSPGGAEVAKKCAEILGGGDVEVAYKTALVHCLGSYDNTTDKMVYDGIQSCSASTFLAGGIASCRFGCMGMGDCVQACEYGAVTVCNGVAQIDPHKCKGCSKCVQACPKKLISFVPLKKQAVVRCSNCDKGRDTMKVCKIGCIGCGKCVKTCPKGAISLKDNCAVVDRRSASAAACAWTPAPGISSRCWTYKARKRTEKSPGKSWGIFLLSLRALRSRPARWQRNLRAQTRLLYSAWIAAKEQFLTAFLGKATIRGRGPLFVPGLVRCQEKVLCFFLEEATIRGRGPLFVPGLVRCKKKFFASFLEEATIRGEGRCLCLPSALPRKSSLLLSWRKRRYGGEGRCLCLA